MHASPHNSALRVRPELLAPAGNWDCARAAVENGADAVYFGLDAGFNARARATNISLDALDELAAYLHRRQVKGYVTLNTLVFTNELESVEAIVRRVVDAGVDAVLVQDLGLVRMIRAICPDLPIHASTQMTLTSAETIRLVEMLGVERVVLARELSIAEIAEIARNTTMPLEVFVHGALCVAYSGQCMTSESLGGRSANRGQCAQACRLPYTLVCDGQDVDLGDQQYLLSPQDLAAYDLVGDLIAAGVSGFKIEGRLKTPEYVANITKHYRQAIDAVLAGRSAEFTPRDVEEMELSFSRGFSPGWLGGCDHKMLVPAISSAKRGVLLGHVLSIHGNRVTVRLVSSIKRGDGVVFEGNRAQNQEQGGRVFEVFSDGRSLSEPVDAGTVQLAFGQGAIALDQLWPDQQVWKTDDPQLTNRLRKSFSSPVPGRRLPLDIEVEAAVGQVLSVRARTDAGVTCRVDSSEPLAPARKHPLTRELLLEQFGRLGGTAYQLRGCRARIAGEPMIPLSVLGRMRHEMVRMLDEAASRPAARRIAETSVLPQLRPSLAPRAQRPAMGVKNRSGLGEGDSPILLPGHRKIGTVPGGPRIDSQPILRVLCRSLEQLRSVLGHNVRSVMTDLQDIRQYGEAVELAHVAGAEILIATPRIQKPGEMGMLRAMLRHAADGILVRNFAGLLFYAEQGAPLVADFALNATNELTVEYLRRLGAERVTASYDLNRDQLLDLVAAVPPAWLEVVVHQHMPMFHMEHCVFCSVLSPGTNKHNCGRPCDVHQVRLRDRVGMEHTLTADVGCRNTLFNAVPQSAAEAVPQLIERGVRDFRLEFLNDAPSDEIGRTIDLYRQLLSGQRTGTQVWSALRAANRVGVTRGTMEERRNPLAIL
jgi:putative protease